MLDIKNIFVSFIFFYSFISSNKIYNNIFTNPF